MRILARLLWVLVLAVPLRSFADPNDLVLSRLGECFTGDQPHACFDPNAATPEDRLARQVIPQNQLFRSLMSELGVVMAPKFLSPADTLGYSGFQFSTELSFTTINKNSKYWCATEESGTCDNVAGKSSNKGSGVLQTVGIIARKGIWLPLPSFEVGAGALYLMYSRMWAAQAFGKLALHEGFHDWPIPSLAVRGGVSHLLGSEQIQLVVASLDVSISKAFGVVGTFSLEPYVGWNYLWIIPRSEVIDKTPNVDAYAEETKPLPASEMRLDDHSLNFVFGKQQSITRGRFFGGIKFKYYVFAMTAEVNIAQAGNSVDELSNVGTCDRAAAYMQNRCDAKDQSGVQQTYALSASLDF